ncbi:MAG: DUF86 domain-containing protein [Lachnospiraceae bacterium]|nr:DUF86 domain-containing protein [Lachnospiraceae bacterium]
MQHRDQIVIQKVLSEIEIGLEMLGEASLEEFLEDEKLKRAVGMTVINIGELIKNVTEETRSTYPKIPWKAVAGMRDIAAHKYQTLRMEDVYNTVKTDFVFLQEELKEILEKETE